MSPACSSWPGRDLLVDDDSGDRRANDAGEACRRIPAMALAIVPRSTPIEIERLKRRIAVGIGARRIGLGLRGLALGNAVVRGKVAVGGREPSRIGRGNDGLAIGADRRRIIRGLRPARAAGPWRPAGRAPRRCA